MIVAIGKLGDVFPQMLAGNVNVRASDRKLEAGPITLNRVGVVDAAHVFLLRVRNYAVRIAAAAQIGISRMFVRADRAACRNIHPHDGFKCGHFGIGHGTGAHNAVTLHDAHDNRLVRVFVTLPLNAPADHGFVHLDVSAAAAHRPPIIGLRHKLAQLVTHAPRALVGHADLSLDFLGRHAVPSGRKEIHRGEPIRERAAGFLKRRANAWVNVVAAKLARISAAFGNSTKARVPPAFWAFNLKSAVAHPHDRIEARGIVRVFGAKLFQGVFHG